MVRYDILCIHTIVGFAPAHQAHWSTKANGTILQSRDTKYRSGANLEGNHRVLAVENEDHGPRFGTWDTDDGHAVPAMTPEQVEANAQILAWVHEEHGVPLILCPNSKSTSRGSAYHRQGIDGNFSDYKYPGRVPGGEVWTNSRGKVCPGDRRTDQRPQILKRAIEIVNGTPPQPQPQKEIDMLIVTPYGSSTWRAICPESRTVVALTQLGYDRLAAAPGVISVALPNDDVRAFEAAYGKPLEVDDVGVPNVSPAPPAP
jgi:hypothetical protein